MRPRCRFAAAPRTGLFRTSTRPGYRYLVRGTVPSMVLWLVPGTVPGTRYAERSALRPGLARPGRRTGGLPTGGAPGRRRELLAALAAACQRAHPLSPPVTSGTQPRGLQPSKNLPPWFLRLQLAALAVFVSILARESCSSAWTASSTCSSTRSASLCTTTGCAPPSLPGLSLTVSSTRRT